MRIAFDRDRYGVLARGTLIADYVEACAWKYGRYQLDDMESLLRRMGRTRARDAYVFGPPVGESEEPDGSSAELEDDPTVSETPEDEGEEGQRYVVRLLRERHGALGTKYPFELDDVAVTWRGNTETAYDSLLAISLAHAFGVDVMPELSTKTVEVLFETVTARCLESGAWRVHNMGDGGRHATSFPAAMAAASEALAWKITPHATPHKRFAHEEGCDTLVMVPWLDQRPGRLFLIGQATVTNSDHWARKIDEPSPGPWGPRLQPLGHPPPVPFLAVSHHVEDGTLRSLQMHAQGIVIDRLRLVCGEKAGDLTADERNVIASVRAADIDT
jgi:hypothetical protein